MLSVLFFVDCSKWMQSAEIIRNVCVVCPVASRTTNKRFHKVIKGKRNKVKRARVVRR